MKNNFSVMRASAVSIYLSSSVCFFGHETNLAQHMLTDKCYHCEDCKWELWHKCHRSKKVVHKEHALFFHKGQGHRKDVHPEATRLEAIRLETIYTQASI